MPAETPAHRETQEQSIKARKHEPFEEEPKEEESGSRMSIREYLRVTPPTPMSRGVKIILWAVAGLVVLLLLVAALTRGTHSAPVASPRAGASPAAPGKNV